MSRGAIAIAVAAVALALAGCDDAVCIRNTDCERGFQCTAAVCTRKVPIDAGPDAGQPADASVPDPAPP